MNKRLVIIGIQEENLLHLKKQMVSIFGDMIAIKGLTLKELNYKSILPGDVVLLSAMEIQGLVKPFLPDSCVALVSKRSINIVNLKQLISREQDSRILVINDNHNNTMQTLDSLRSILPNHTYYPYIAQQKMPVNIDFVITPGETNLIPAGYLKTLDIGPRIIAIETLMELKKYFHLKITDALLMQLYIKTMVYLTEENGEKDTVTIHSQNQHRTFNQLSTKSSGLLSTIKVASRIAQTSKAIHIEGEVGSGKQMLAEMLHNASFFSAEPFYVYNCADKDLALMNEELFGRMDNGREGIVNQITSGTLYLKNIDQLPYSPQGKLFNFMETLEGNTQTTRVRIITSSINNLNDLFQRELIRTNIYSYLSPYVLKMPPLSERKEDIPGLIDDFKRHFKKTDLQFSTSVMNAFYHYDWPGNVRELYNVISYCVCLHESCIKLESLPLFFKGIQRNVEDNGKENETLNMQQIIDGIEQHGFLSESIRLLQIYQTGKIQNESYGRGKMKSLLAESNFILTDQQLRLRIEVLNKLGLLNVRIGRAGTTISEKGERFLCMYEDSQIE